MCAGAVTIGGATTFSAATTFEDAVSATGSGNIDFSGSTGTFLTSTGAHDPSKTDKTHDVVPHQRFDTTIDP